MKKAPFLKFLVAAFAVAIAFTALPTTASAGGNSHRSYSHKCGGCGGSVYKKRVFSHRDRCGHPVYRWVRISHRCAPRPPACSHGHGHGHSRIHPAEIIVPILNFISSQQNQKRSYGSGYHY